MTTQPPNILQLAQQGDPRAIAALINRNLQPKGITAKVGFKDDCIQILLEAAQVPEQNATIGFLYKGVKNLEIPSAQRLRVYGRQTGQEIPAWTQEIALSSDFTSHGETPNPESKSIEVLKLSEQASVKNTSNLSANSIPVVAGKVAKPKLKWFETDSPILIIGLLILFFPLGLWSMWKYAKWTRRTKWIITGGIAALFLVPSVFNEPKEPVQEKVVTKQPTSPRKEPVQEKVVTKQPTSPRTFLGKSQTGYELWADERCVYVKGITEGDLARLNTNVWGFKDAVKSQTGYKCVLFE